ncbi:MAG: nodulation protein NfeD, partial [Gammaproteobacteria bacterium]|nr:nodulation protein NfeD [Gammaproteobacteria bacterium]
MPASLLLLALFWSALPVAATTTVIELEIDGAIGVATADYISSGIDHAEDVGAELVIIKIDTPGGLMKPTREIVQRILAASVPVAAYVTPAGARADSAGTYILLSCHVAAMTPTSHLGAATPVPLMNAAPPSKDDGDGDGDGDGEQSGSAADRKVMNDAVSYIRSLAERHGRNADWAETAVTEAATLTATEALEQGVIEFIAADRDELLTQVDGFDVEIDGQSRPLSTSDVHI